MAIIKVVNVSTTPKSFLKPLSNLPASPRTADLYFVITNLFTLPRVLYKWNNTVFTIFVCFFTHHNYFDIYLGCWVYK